MKKYFEFDKLRNELSKGNYRWTDNVPRDGYILVVNPLMFHLMDS